MSERAYRYRKGTGLGTHADSAGDAGGRTGPRSAGWWRPWPTTTTRYWRKCWRTSSRRRRNCTATCARTLLAGSVIEVLVGAAENANGVRRLWKALRHDTPRSRPRPRNGANIVPGGAPRAQVFKTAYAGHTGKLSYARIWSGTITDGAQLGGTRLGGIYRYVNGELTKVPEAKQGDIVAFGRLDGVPTGATLSPGGQPEPLPFPQPDTPPVYAMAIATTDRKDDVKLSGALHKLAEEDPSLFVTQDGETVLHGQGEMHLQTTVDHLARDYGLKLATHKPGGCLQGNHPQSSARARTAQAPDRRSRPVRRRQDRCCATGARRGLPVHRQDRRRRGSRATSSPRSATPPRKPPAKGPFGYPVVDVSVTLVDGGFHSVDSSDMAFKTATQIAMKEALAKADPVLLEPVDHVTISVPNDYTARAQRLLTGRRGQILGFAERPGWPGWDDVEALVPEAELHDLIIELRSQTMGLGTFRRSGSTIWRRRARSP